MNSQPHAASGRSPAISIGESGARAPRFQRLDKFLVVFIGLALTARLVFWLYTGRIWEDALITLTPARNAWEGFGLTHHASEPRVHSFTSPLSVLIPLAGESIGQGLLALRLASLAAGAAAIHYAYRLGRELEFHWAGLVALLSYLALDHLQIFFGMSGMETQIATSLALANAYYWLTSQWRKLGLALGLGLLCRPEFCLWAPILGLSILLIRNYRALIPVVGLSSAIFVPWIVFATLYYGSPIPHTIVAKSFSFRAGLHLPIDWRVLGNYFLASWKSVAPFREYWFVQRSPIPDAVLVSIVLLVAVLALIGMARASVHRPRMLAVAAFMLAFFAYYVGSVIIPYYMWYLRPFLALAAVFAGYGISTLALAAPRLACASGLAIALAYSLPLPFVLPLDRRMQIEVDDAVRARVGRRLDSLMGPDDTAVLEPLGYIGWFARNKTIYDFPGLGSKVAVRALRTMRDTTPCALIRRLKPTFAVLRPHEYERLRDSYQEIAELYTVVEDIKGPTERVIGNLGTNYGIADGEFLILRRAR